MTTCLALDAGIVFKLIIPHPRQAHFVQLMGQWQAVGYRLYAPTLWAYEVTSTFTKLAHFGHLSSSDSLAGLRLAYQLGIELVPPDTEQVEKAFAWTERLHRAAAYDSFYLALAETLNCDLWTVDKRLAQTAGQSWVKLAE